MDGEWPNGATLPSPGGPGVRLGEGPGVRAAGRGHPVARIFHNPT
jgi:hypothetical protein